MKSLWKPNEVKKIQADLLALRVYTSQLLGRESDLVLQGGGNTSVKIKMKDDFGDEQDILFVKGSGWDLATIEKPGFAPVKLEALKRMAEFDHLTDRDMVRMQRAAMLNPNAPNPSVEAILHAIIPFRFVDHTHADAVVAVSNTKDGEKRIKEIYGKRVLIVPYVMPGFILAKKIYEMTKSLDWSSIEGIVLHQHGIFTFNDEAKDSYQTMIRLVDQAEKYLKKKGAVFSVPRTVESKIDYKVLAHIRKVVSQAAKASMLAKCECADGRLIFSRRKNLREVAGRGPLTPDHVIRTKRIPVVIKDDPVNDVAKFTREYQKYFKKYARDEKPLDPSPRWAVWPEVGTICFGRTFQEVEIVSDISLHTIRAIESAERLGGWNALSEKDIFEMEYWELEQAKLKKAAQVPAFLGKIVLVTGAASGIGRACVEIFRSQGAVVVALDLNASVKTIFADKAILPICCDVTKISDLQKAVELTVSRFGGLDVVVSNAGTFPSSEHIAQMRMETWEKSLTVNLNSHQQLLKETIPYLSLGIDPSVIVVGSKNVPAPGPGASAYSVAKAGLTQLARIAALELAPLGIRVNVVHPNAVFDTGIWTKDVLAKRAKAYGMSVDDYKISNLLKVVISAKDVAELIAVMAGTVFLKTTGAQIPIDGGNDRVI